MERRKRIEKDPSWGNVGLRASGIKFRGCFGGLVRLNLVVFVQKVVFRYSCWEDWGGVQRASAKNIMVDLKIWLGTAALAGDADFCHRISSLGTLC